jgi:hypothetical protein
MGALDGLIDTHMSIAKSSASIIDLIKILGRQYVVPVPRRSKISTDAL